MARERQAVASNFPRDNPRRHPRATILTFAVASLKEIEVLTAYPKNVETAWRRQGSEREKHFALIHHINSLRAVMR